MTDTPAGQQGGCACPFPCSDCPTEGVPEWDPFRSDDPQINFLIAAIVTSAVVLVESPADGNVMRTLLMAANEFKKACDARLGQG